jgi:ParB family transcriptional regulator, chromosome partitioning protein
MSKNHEQRKALGKGLSALLPSRTAPVAQQPRSEAVAAAPPQPHVVQHLPIDSIEPNPVQPRSVFQNERLAELAQSIRANGIIQPLIVRRVADRYQLVAGERRWRAARLAGLTDVPVFVQDFAEGRLLEVALIENIQREDLNPIEVAQALDRLAREHSLSHEEIGQRTGKDRATVTNLIRLLRLPQEIQLLVAEHRLSMGHARAILGLPTEDLQKDVAQRAAAENLSVRQVERLIQTMTSKREAQPLDRTASGENGQPAYDPNVAAATRELEATLGTRVRIISQSSSRGKIEIDYFSADDLDRIYNLIVATRN